MKIDNKGKIYLNLLLKGFNDMKLYFKITNYIKIEIAMLVLII